MLEQLAKLFSLIVQPAYNLTGNFSFYPCN